MNATMIEKMSEKHVYQPPMVFVCSCVLEKGFAVTGVTEKYGVKSLNSMFSDGTEQYGTGNANMNDLQGSTSSYTGETTEGDFWRTGGF